ncbi:OmpA family protein [Vibrio sp. D431a]|uniref:OmpA family protein n=1 Tax=Vibrio sp. D431a TaxID=2837388 RepID=UPI002553B9A9|nr:OmpA family protein [Vibrio sp. D431a]MDK9793227.1 OmpA family protein [Vibrio sp. D431a]
MNKKWLVLLLPVVMTGCSSTGSSNSATSGSYYEEAGEQVVFESLDEVFEAEQSSVMPSENQVTESRTKILSEGGYTQLDIDELESKGVDLSILEHSIVGFGFDSYKVDATSSELISKHAQLLKELPNLKVILEGHTDKRGDRAYNLKLGENRAIAVKDLLTGKYEINPDRIEIISFGKEKLVDSGDTEAAHKANRRAEFRYN